MSAKNIIGVVLLLFSATEPIYGAELVEVVDGLQQSLKERARIKTVAVLPFVYLDGSYGEASEIIAERLTMLVVNKWEVTVVERKLLGKVFGELKLEASGFVDPVLAKRLGRQLQVDAIISGTLNDLKSKETEVNARLIEVQTGALLAAVSKKIPSDWRGRRLFDYSSLPEMPNILPPPRVRSDVRIFSGDMAALESYSEATKSDNNPEVSPESKEKNWRDLCDRYNGTEVGLKSCARADEWREYSMQKRAHDAGLARRNAAMNSDWAILDKLLSFSGFPSDDEKSKAVMDFMDAYGKETPYFDKLCKDTRVKLPGSICRKPIPDYGDWTGAWIELALGYPYSNLEMLKFAYFGRIGLSAALWGPVKDFKNWEVQSLDSNGNSVSDRLGILFHPVRISYAPLIYQSHADDTVYFLRIYGEQAAIRSVDGDFRGDIIRCGLEYLGYVRNSGKEGSWHSSLDLGWYRINIPNQTRSNISCSELIDQGVFVQYRAKLF